jgi:hypothetical protein
MRRLDLTVELFPVKCTGCDVYVLAGTGHTNDPLLDVSFEESTNEYVCHSCITAQEKRVLN